MMRKARVFLIFLIGNKYQLVMKYSMKECLIIYKKMNSIEPELKEIYYK